MKTIQLGFTFFAVLLLFACKKNDAVDLNNLNGTYTGTVAFSNNNPAVNYVPISGNVTVVLSGNNYSSTSPFPTYSADAKGSFMRDGSQVTFTNTLVHTANFDWGLILTDSYASSVKGDSLFLTKQSGFNFYKYKLKRQ